MTEITAKKGFFGKLRERLGKTRSGLVDRVKRVLTGHGAINDDVFNELEEILIGADIGVATTLSIITDMRSAVREHRLSEPDELYDLLKQKLAEAFDDANTAPLTWTTPDGPFVALIVGVNGSGKTTTTGKLAAQLAGEGKSVLLGAADTFRAAAVEQLAIWSDRANVPLIRHQEGSDPAAVAFDAVDAAVARKADCVLVDTAGRLHTKVNLMEELKKIQRVVKKRLSGAPHLVLLVMDATTGQNGLQQARIFTEALAVDGIVLTKLDGTAKGGIAVAIQRELGIPIRYIGVGESLEDLQPFNAREFVDALFT